MHEHRAELLPELAESSHDRAITADRYEAAKSFAVQVPTSDDRDVATTVRRVRSDEGDVLKTVRLAALQDAPFAFASTFDSEVRRTDEEWAARARSGSEGVDRATFFALTDDCVVGLAGGFRPGADRALAELVSMWTAPDSRGAGVGRALVRAVVDWARDTYATAVDVWVTAGNDPARLLYQAVGFRDAGEAKALPSDPSTTELRLRLLL